MASLQASVRGQSLGTSDDIAGLVTNVNQLVYDASPENRYATFFYAQFDPATRRLIYTNGGHNPPMLLRGLEVILLEIGGPPVGLFRPARYKQAEVQLEAGDVLVFYTDGISEAENRSEDEWGEAALIAAARSCREQPAMEMITRIMTAADTFASLYRLQALRRVAERAFANLDAMVLPTAPTAYSTAQVLANPIELNSRLGTYTNFVNLLDLCGLALPAAMRADGIPFGITLLAPAGRDAALASIGRVFHADTKLKMGAKGLAQPALAALPTEASGDEITIAVVGAHLSGMALNGELLALGARLIEATTTAPDYKLYALDTTPPKPGMLRVDAGVGHSIKLELWALPSAAFGKFVAAIPPPLGIGTIRLADGRGVKGFMVEPVAIDSARDISAFGGWRAFMAEKI